MLGLNRLKCPGIADATHVDHDVAHGAALIAAEVEPAHETEVAVRLITREAAAAETAAEAVAATIGGPKGVLVCSRAVRTAVAILSRSPRAEICTYITCGDSFIR